MRDVSNGPRLDPRISRKLALRASTLESSHQHCARVFRASHQPRRTTSSGMRWRIELGMIVGRVLMAALGAFYMLYASKPRLPVIRALPSFGEAICRLPRNGAPSLRWWGRSSLSVRLFLVHLSCARTIPHLCHRFCSKAHPASVASEIWILDPTMCTSRFALRKLRPAPMLVANYHALDPDRT